MHCSHCGIELDTEDALPPNTAPCCMACYLVDVSDNDHDDVPVVVSAMLMTDLCEYRRLAEDRNPLERTIAYVMAMSAVDLGMDFDITVKLARIYLKTALTKKARAGHTVVDTSNVH